MKAGRRERALFITAFLAPAVLLFAGFVLVPLGQAIAVSFTRWRGVSAQQTWVGLANYQRLAQDNAFWGALGHNLWLLLGVGAGILALALPIAHALHQPGRLGAATRTLALFPQVISTVVVAILWMFLLNPSFGLLDSLLRGLGLPTPRQGWLGTSSLALPSVGVALLWSMLGFYVLLFAAGIRGLSADVMEASELDGATGWRRFRWVTWPMLWAVRRTAMVYLGINLLNTFAVVYLMTQGGPDRRTEVMLTYLYQQAFTHGQFGYATAVAVVSLVAALLLSGLLMAVFREPGTPLLPRRRRRA